VEGYLDLLAFLLCDEISIPFVCKSESVPHQNYLN
jgi:hypothetical protein